MENAKKFFEEIIKTEEAKALLASIEKPDTEEAVAAAYAEVAKKLGAELTAEEVAAYFAAADATDAELDDEELSQLVGGRDADAEHENCVYSFKNTENCWFQDACDNSWKEYDGYKCHHQNDGASILTSVLKSLFGAAETAKDVIKDRNNGSN